MKVNSSSSVPLYDQLAGDIREKIRTKVYAPGDQIPTEKVLCEKYGISRITVRRALDELVNDGYLERRQGKGTYVAIHHFELNLVSLDGELTRGFTDSTNAPFLIRRILAKRIYEPTTYERELLALDEDDSVQILERYLENSSIKILEKAGYSRKRYPGFLEKIEDMTSTYHVLRSDYGMTRKRILREVSVTGATEEQARLLGCLAGTMLFRIVKVLYDQDDIPVHYSMMSFIAENTVIRTDS